MSDCACLYGGFDDYDECGFTATSTVVARKQHACYECESPIPKGQLHQKASQKYEGAIRTYRFCLLCVEIREALYCDGGWYWGRLWHDVRDQIFEQGGLTIACIDKLTTPEAKTFLQRRYMEHLGV